MNDQEKAFQKAATGDYVVLIKDAATNNGEYTEAYPIGFFDDAMRGGVRAGDLIIITGKSGDGKTMLAQNIALTLDKIPMPVMFFSFEVLIDNLYAKFKEMGISEEALIHTPKKNITGKLNWIKEKIIEGKEKFDTRVVFIDDITYLSPTDTKSSDQYRMVLQNICVELKNFAIEKKIAIFLMAHVKKVQGREIEMQDVAESSGIFQKCDYLFAIRRAEADENWGGTKSKNSIKILKNRSFGYKPSLNFTVIHGIIKPI